MPRPSRITTLLVFVFLLKSRAAAAWWSPPGSLVAAGRVVVHHHHRAAQQPPVRRRLMAASEREDEGEGDVASDDAVVETRHSGYNVLGTELSCCCSDVGGSGIGTGFYRNGLCGEWWNEKNHRTIA